MVNLDQLPKITQKSQKRLGRGYGSGKGGHTVGRGQKGQKSRGRVKLLFEGTKIRKSFLQRMPMLRGKKRLKSIKPKPFIIKVGELEKLANNSLVTKESLIKAKIAGQSELRGKSVKILSGGKLTKKLKVSLPISQKALEIVEKAGGKTEKK